MQGEFVVVDPGGLGICLFDQCGKLIREISEPTPTLALSGLSSLEPKYLIFDSEGQLCSDLISDINVSTKETSNDVSWHPASR